MQCFLNNGRLYFLNTTKNLLRRCNQFSEFPKNHEYKYVKSLDQYSEVVDVANNQTHSYDQIVYDYGKVQTYQQFNSYSNLRQMYPLEALNLKYFNSTSNIPLSDLQLEELQSDDTRDYISANQLPEYYYIPLVNKSYHQLSITGNYLTIQESSFYDGNVWILLLSEKIKKLVYRNVTDFLLAENVDLNSMYASQAVINSIQNINYSDFTFINNLLKLSNFDSSSPSNLRTPP